MRLRLLFVFLWLSTSCFSQLDYGKSICQELSSPKFQGRGYIKGGDSLAAKFIADEFAKLKVSSFRKSYFQKFLFTVNTFPNDIHLKINGKELAVGQDYIPNEASGKFVGTWNFKKVDDELWMNQSSVMLLADSIENGYYNSVILEDKNYKGDSLNTFRRVKSTLQSIAKIMLVTDKKLTFSIATDQNPTALVTVKKEALPLNITTIESDIQPILTIHPTQNVIGVLPAKKKAKKAPYIFFTAHYDHLGGIGNQAYFPGASDNASGVAMLLSMAKYFKQHPSKYNMVFIAFAGEEAGLIGSRYYVEHPILPLEKIKFLVNLDLMGNGEDGITVVNGSVFQKEFDILQEINQEKQLLPIINSRGKAANSDHYFFTESGVPSFFIYTLGKNQNYHDIYDKYGDLSFAKFQEIIDLLIEFVNRI